MTDWRKIVNTHGDAVRRTAYRILGNEADAADCLQEAFMAAFELSGKQRIRHWRRMLQVLATRKALDRLRTRIRQAARTQDVERLESLVSVNPGPVAQAEAAELAERLRAALGQLPPQQAETFCLRYLGEMSYRQIAGQLGIKTDTAGVLLYRARARLRQLLSEAGATGKH